VAAVVARVLLGRRVLVALVAVVLVIPLPVQLILVAAVAVVRRVEPAVLVLLL
jgi:hypothetical protein